MDGDKVGGREGGKVRGRGRAECRSGAPGRTPLGCRGQGRQPEERQRQGAIYMWRWLERRETTW